MLCDGMALLCALAAGLVAVSLAARSHPEPTTVRHVMDTIGALLQSRSGADAEVLSNLQLLASQQITPGAHDSMSKALTKVISEIEQGVEAKIKASHADTQAAFDQKIRELKTETEQALAQKKNADDSDTNWFNCVRDEKAEREAIEEAVRKVASSRSNTNEPCQLQEDTKLYKRDPEASALHFKCDISKNGNCNHQLQNYKTQIKNMGATLKSEALDAANSFAQAKDACDKAKANVVKTQSAQSDAIAAWELKRAQCLKLHEARLLSMCLFGTDLQRKCGKVAAYHAHVADTDRVKGGGYSHPDRVQEWKTTAVAKCMLSKVAAGDGIKAAELDGCANSVNFDRDVGVLHRQNTEFSDLTTADKFTCSEKSIEFGGETWEVPQGDAPSSSEYTTKRFEPEVSLAEDTDPFVFCAEAERDWIHGEEGIKSGYVLVDGNPKSDGRSCGFVQKTGLDEICADPADVTVAGTRCCSNTTVKTRGKSICDAGKCSTLNFADSSAACEKVGMRLCQANELLAGYTSGSGCNYDHHYVWSSKKCGTEVNDYLEPPPAELPLAPTQKQVERGFVVVDGNPKSDGNACGFVQVPGIDQICADPDDNKVAGARCCSDEGKKGSSICTSGRCHTLTYMEAKEACESAGQRLCQANELMAGLTSGTGCNYDHHYVWSNKTCGSEVEDYEESEVGSPERWGG